MFLLTNSWELFVLLSGYRALTIFYFRTLFRREVFKCFIIFGCSKTWCWSFWLFRWSESWSGCRTSRPACRCEPWRASWPKYRVFSWVSCWDWIDVSKKLSPACDVYLRVWIDGNFAFGVIDVVLFCLQDRISFSGWYGIWMWTIKVIFWQLTAFLCGPHFFLRSRSPAFGPSYGRTWIFLPDRWSRFNCEKRWNLL